MKRLNANHEARFYKRLPNGKVRCNLCPRRCLIDEGRVGFCKVRMNRKGTLHALSYGKAVIVSDELIETEAVFHFEPGSRILSLGNVGCNLACVFCQNWRFSQIEEIDEDCIFDYTPEQVVDMALDRKIKILSWTYNDPAVWLEFVLDTARLAKSHGLYNLFKSALFLTPEAIEALKEVIDIFSISIKSLDAEYYRKMVKAWLTPVLEGTRQVFNSHNHHIEISNLVVTGVNDTDKDYLDLINWVKSNLSADVPIHFVGFHPDYKYKNVLRTSEGSLVRARELAKQVGIKHCYIGNVFLHEGLNTYCSNCNNILVERRGLNAEPIGIEASKEGYICRRCKNGADIEMIDGSVK